MKLLNILFTIALSMIIIMIASKLIVDKKRLEGESRYTIAFVSGYDTRNFSYFYYYDYTVNGIQYEALATPHKYEPSQVVGKRFYVRYYPVDPDNSEILFEQPVQDSSVKPPPNGWDELPYQ